MDARTDIAKAIAAITDIDEAELSSYIEIPPDRSMGDYAFPCFRLAKAMRKAPPQLPRSLGQGLHCPHL